jgi:hypothetical protein
MLVINNGNILKQGYKRSEITVTSGNTKQQGKISNIGASLLRHWQMRQQMRQTKEFHAGSDSKCH